MWSFQDSGSLRKISEKIKNKEDEWREEEKRRKRGIMKVE